MSVGKVLKEIATFLLSQFGLLVLVVSYSVAGAIIFGQLERPNEKNSCKTNRDLYTVAETSMIYRMWEVVKAYQQLNDYDDATNALQGLLGEFKDTVRTAVALAGSTRFTSIHYVARLCSAPQLRYQPVD